MRRKDGKARVQAAISRKSEVANAHLKRIARPPWPMASIAIHIKKRAPL
jgi:hypothetical protein